MGDSKSPLIFLGVSAILNIMGDLFFVIVFKLGIHGVAISTVISEGLSALMCLIYIKKNVPVLNLGSSLIIQCFIKQSPMALLQPSNNPQSR
ncbi:polysaccharide biosynthesis C-terminal domain-containing protein [Sharpea azabuensis]|uniref:polysaccharide biosynthesis C-terminal domain-containing protein n=1 Tax=Sharpea azabuensis TaxID=322505 RepID=UPI0023F4552E|nr:polysaccharide biosynthesis C-terminal domain-containing protein [Sharpea azabuensis]